MDHRKRRAVFAVDGYEISATFADSRNTAVLGHVKQILLSSFANNLTDKTPGDSLALKAKLSDNNSGIPLCTLKSSYTPCIDSLFQSPLDLQKGRINI